MPKSIRTDGVFWLESNPTKTIPGRLTFNPKRGGKLELHGSFGRLEAPGMNLTRVLGDIRGASCVLGQCFELSRSGFGREHGSHVTLFVNTVLTAPRGTHPSDDEVYDSIWFETEGLSEFDGRPPFSGGLSNGHEPAREWVSVESLPPRSVKSETLTWEITHGTGSRGGNGFDEVALTSTHFARVGFRAPLELGDVQTQYTWVRALMMLALHRDCRLKGPITLVRADDKPREQTTEFHGIWPRGPRSSRPIFVDRVLTFDQLTDAGVARLLDLEPTMGHVVRRLSTLHLDKAPTFEGAIVGTVSAADSLYREISGTQRAPTATSLAGLAEFVGPRFTDHVPRLADWITDIVRYRDDAAHNKGQTIEQSALVSPMIWSVYWLTVLGVLVHAEVPDDAVIAAATSQPFIHTMVAIGEHYR